MDTPETQIIERFGLFFEEDGLPRIAGRVFGLMMLSDEALTLDEMAEALKVSKASVSTNTRLLHQFGTLERVAKPGDRRTYYQISPDALSGSFERMKQRTAAIDEFLIDVEQKLPAHRTIARSRLERLSRWHTFILNELDDIWARWQEAENENEHENAP